jgi:hypothetical protein
METCPKCKGSMDHGEVNGMVNWVTMPVGASLLTRLARGLKYIRIDGLRCTNCGFLELYAKARR